MRGPSSRLTKLTRPGYTGIYERKRIFSLLDRLRRRHKTVWISATAGSGKTTLVSSYLTSRKIPCLWYQVDGGDADPATFFYYMGLAARKAAPRSKPLPLLTPEYMPGLHTFARRYFETLCSRLKHGSCIVFDNCNELSTDCSFFEVLNTAIEAAPAGINFILISREEPPGSFARHLSTGAVETLDPSELLLTRKETFDVIKLKSKTALSRTLMEGIYSMTRGWFAGLALTLRKSGSLNIENLSAITSTTISGYFASEILKRLDGATRDFILQTALFPSMDADMAEGLTGNRNARHILSTLSSKNCFTQRHAGARFEYQYHPLFREFLLSNLDAKRDRASLNALRGKAAEILVKAGRHEDAFHLLRASEYWQGATTLILAHASTLLSEGRIGILSEWILSVPLSVREGSPWLIYWLGISRLPFNPGESRTILERSFASFRENGDTAGAILSWSGKVDACVYEGDRYGVLDGYIDEYDSLAATGLEYPSAQAQMRFTASIFNALIFRRPDHPDFHLWKGRMEEIALNGAPQDCSIFLAVYCMWTGRFNEAKALIDLFPANGEASPLTRLSAITTSAMHNWLTASFAACFKDVEDGIAMAEATGVHVWDFHIISHGIAGALSTGDYVLADKLINRVSPHLGRLKRLDRGYFEYLLCWDKLARKDTNGLKPLMERLIEDCEALGLYLGYCHYYTMMAQLLYETGEAGKARTYLKSAFKYGRTFESDLVVFMCHIIEAHIEFDSGNEDRGAAALKKAFSLGREHGYMNFFCWRQDVMAKLAARALECGIETEYVRELIRARGITPSANDIGVDDWPWAVKVYTLGRVGIIINGQAVALTPSNSGKPLDLLKALIALGGRDVPQERVIDALWPESEGDAAHRALISTLYRLRKIIGNEVVIFRNGLFAINPACCWVDAWSLERNLDRAWRIIKKEGFTDCAVQSVEKAGRMYHGHMLPGDEGKTWTIAARERLRDRILNALGEAGCHFEKEKKPEKAIHFFKKAFDIDPITEAFCQHLMSCHLSAGNRSEAIAIFNRFKTALSDNLGLTPSARTEEIYKSIRPG